MTSEEIRKETLHCMDCRKSERELDKHGYIQIINEIFKDPATIYHMMNMYDMQWKVNENDYPDYVDKLNELHQLSSYTQNQKIGGAMVQDILAHKTRMELARPVSVKPERLTMSDCQKLGEADIMYTDNYVQDIAAEPMSDYGSKKNDWVSYTKSDKKPTDRERCLVCGYYYAGSIDYGVGIWMGNGWKLPFDNDSSKPDFTVLYWKPVDECPKEAYNEVVYDI